LRAVSHSVKDVGYIQGLNSIAGVLLLRNLSPIRTYWMLLYLLKKLKVSILLNYHLKKLDVLNYQLEVFSRLYLEKIYSFIVRLKKPQKRTY
jgi:hypothetical protein